jgi:hypothetical protein
VPRVLVCGDRAWDRVEPIRVVLTGLRAVHGEVVVLHGAAPGADTITDGVARDLGLPVEVFAPEPPGGLAQRRARNERLVVEGRPDLVYAFCDVLEDSPGTAQTVALARDAGVAVIVVSAR